MAGPTFVSLGTDAVNTSGAVPVPAGAAGDLLLFTWESDNVGDVAAASGWTGANSTYGTHPFGYLWKFDAGSGGGTQAFTGLNDANFNIGFITRYSGVDTGTPVNVAALETTSASTVSITTTVDNCMEIAAFTWDAGVGSNAAPAGWTRRHDGNGGNWYSAERLKAVAGATGTSAFPNPTGQNGCVHLALAPAAAAGATVKASFPLVTARVDDVLPGEIRPHEVQSPDFSSFWFDAGAVIASADISVVGLLPVGASLVADVTHAASVAGILPVGAVPVATVSHDATAAGILPVGATPVGLVSHDATVAGILPLGAVQVAITRLDVPTIGLLPVGATLVGTISHAASVVGILPVGAVPVATISHDATVAGILPVGSTLVALISHNAAAVGILPVGAVLVAVVTGASDISVVGVLTVGASLVASVSHQALVSGVLPLGASLVAPVSHTAAVTGVLPVGLTLTGGVTHNASVVGILPVGAVLVAIGGAFGTIPTITYPTTFVVLPNSRLGVDVNPGGLTIELGSSSLVFVAGPSGLLIPLTPPNEGLELS